MPSIATCSLESNGAYSQSKAHREPKLNKEKDDAYEERTWRYRAHATADGKVYIPGIQFKKCLEEAAGFLSDKIPGRGQATYTKHFLAGVMVDGNLELPVTMDKVQPYWGFMNADGKRGGGKRVMRAYPQIDHWKGVVKFIILDSTITHDVFARTLQEGGNLIGVGRWRPRVGGQNGRFRVLKTTWQELQVT